MKKVIITGATSFIGLNIIDKLLEKDYEILALVRKDSTNAQKLPKAKNIKTLNIDLNEIKNLSNLIYEEYDIFFHLAWNGTRGSDRDDAELQESNYAYSMDAIRSAHELGCKIFIGAGSQAEYGLYNCKISESTECNPVTEYGKAKLKVFEEGYNLCQKLNISFKWPRFFSLYGVGDYEGTLIISTIDKMLLGEDVKLTEGVQLWNFLHVRDAAEGLIKLIETNCLDGAYNFGSNDTRELKEFVLEIYRNIQTKSNILFGAIPYPSTGMVSVNPDVNKLKNEINWEPQIIFSEGIKEIIMSRRKKLGVKNEKDKCFDTNLQ